MVWAMVGWVRGVLGMNTSEEDGEGIFVANIV